MKKKSFARGLLVASLASGALLAMSVQAVAQPQYLMKIKVGGLKQQPTELYEFTGHRFTNCGQTGAQGPTLSMCRSAYSTSWDDDPNLFYISTRGIQEWVVPEDGTYRITAAGARGGEGRYSPGNGAIMRGDFDLTEGERLYILVGQRGLTFGDAGGGGGGSFVVKGSIASPQPLVVAGGGGGGGQDAYQSSSAHGSITSNGKKGYQDGGSGGSSGNGGQAGSRSEPGAGGAGLFGSGVDATYANGGIAFKYGGVGGYGDQGGDGGFGGGGEAGRSAPGGGGAGGYSGGGGGNDSGGDGNGGGGGSFNAGANQSNSSGQNTGHGYVDIQKLN